MVKNIKSFSLRVVLNLFLGVHSVLASSIAKKVYAIDPLTLAIEDGKFNAKLNECQDNIEWICGFAEAHLHRILKKIGDLHGDNSNLVAIVNPFRYGLGMVDIKIQFCLNRMVLLIRVFIIATKTTSALRSLPSIRRILYVLGKSDEQAMHNFYEYVYLLIKNILFTYNFYTSDWQLVNDQN